jgi:serine/threonine protein kinase
MFLSDRTVERLRSLDAEPDLTGTRYRLGERIARGGMGTVYSVQDTALDRSVALKVLHAPDPRGELATRLLREARILADLEHPGIVPVHDVGTLADGRVFYTMKLVRGKRLDHYLENVAALPDRLRIFQKICDAVAFAHAHGVLHRDLKPANIMVGAFGEVLVMDWGVAKVFQDAPTAITAAGTPGRDTLGSSEETPRTADTVDGAVLGTPGYMSPEQARGEIASLDQRADIYSLGAILHFLVSSAHAPTMPRAVAAICNKAMAPDPIGRYPDVQELSADVASYLDGLPVAAFPEGPLRKTWRWLSRNRTWVLLILAYLIMRAALFLWRGR